ncbi:uncharacterized protein LOC107225077 [Neodiprion lecontei]|uniref:Uncharacterized protein LOC107225077 n=1 Tax=Neodiprion lecontei TaxID=441921 RepID=A0A6J0C3A7_NEOLC|nr:uncharacterized protein LOC107225077 [Neodiprion lecontei]
MLFFLLSLVYSTDLSNNEIIIAFFTLYVLYTVIRSVSSFEISHLGSPCMRSTGPASFRVTGAPIPPRQQQQQQPVMSHPLNNPNPTARLPPILLFIVAVQENRAGLAASSVRLLAPTEAIAVANIALRLPMRSDVSLTTARKLTPALHSPRVSPSRDEPAWIASSRLAELLSQLTV